MKKKAESGAENKCLSNEFLDKGHIHIFEQFDFFPSNLNSGPIAVIV